MNNLTGTVPADLGQLTQLTFLRLEQNQHLGGVFPSSLVQLPRLSSLKLVRSPTNRDASAGRAPCLGL